MVSEQTLIDFMEGYPVGSSTYEMAKELREARATLANRAAVREPAKCETTQAIEDSRKDVSDERLLELKLWLDRKWNRHHEEEDLEAGNALAGLIGIRRAGPRSVEPKTETLAELVGDARGEMADYREAMTEPKPVTCSPITEPSMRHDEEWDGMVVRFPPVALRPADAEGPKGDCPTCAEHGKPHFGYCCWKYPERSAEEGECGHCDEPSTECSCYSDLSATPPAPQVSPNSSSTSQEVREALEYAANMCEILSERTRTAGDGSCSEVQAGYAAVLRCLATPSDGPT